MSLILLVISVLLLGCHSPDQFIGGERQSTSAQLQGGKVYPINPDLQICNPGISTDTVRFPRAMLWLGFAGQLNVKNAPEGYTTTKVKMHDRLTISGHDNSVLWFMTMDQIPSVQCEFQDPDWSAHPEWIVTLGAQPQGKNCDNSDTIWYSGYVIRPADNAYFRFADRSLDHISTPNFWIDQAPEIPTEGVENPAWQKDTVDYSQGFATPQAVQDYFGTKNVKFTWSKEHDGMTLYYIDYSESKHNAHRLAKPRGRENWKGESAMISPDGKWITYNLFERQDTYSAYIQELRPNSTPILIAEGAMEPRWFVHPADPERWYIIYITVPAGNTYIITQALDESQVEKDGSAGATWMQEVKLSAGMPQDLSYSLVGEPEKLVNLPFRAGRSPDGRWLATGTNNGYMLELP